MNCMAKSEYVAAISPDIVNDSRKCPNTAGGTGPASVCSASGKTIPPGNQPAHDNPTAQSGQRSTRRRAHANLRFPAGPARPHPRQVVTTRDTPPDGTVPPQPAPEAQHWQHDPAEQ